MNTPAPVPDAAQELPVRRDPLAYDFERLVVQDAADFVKVGRGSAADAVNAFVRTYLTDDDHALVAVSILAGWWAADARRRRAEVAARPDHPEEAW